MAIWTPALAGRRGPKYLQIVEALAEDLAAGVLAPGVRLPPHRELAYALGLSPNTASRAYAEAVRRGLLRGEVGRGTFVRAAAPPAPVGRGGDLRRPGEGPIDLSRNLPAPGPAAEHLARTLDELRRADDLAALLDYQTEGDLARHAEAALAWLGRAGVAAHAEDAVLVAGAQHGIFCALMAVARPGDLLLVEALSYAPVRAMAARLGLGLAGVAMDAEGLRPDALAAACRRGGARALYLTPTLQSPTGVTMGAARRREIAEVARQFGLLLIEDDVFGGLKPDAPPPLAALAEERTVFVTSTSKCLTPGLRVGFVRAPAELASALRDAVHATCWMPPPLMAEVAARWILDGTAEVLAERQRATAARRQGLARRLLAGHEVQGDPCALHLWLPLPERWPAEAFRAEAARRGVLVTEAAAFAAKPGAAPNALRLCLSHEAAEARLIRGLEIVVRLLEAPATGAGLFL